MCMLDYKLIEALAAVVQEGGFEKAAKALYITQSAVSQRVKLLEDQTGRILLARGTPPTPTPHGRKMLKHFLQVKQLEDDLLGEMDEKADQGFSSMAIGVNADSLATWFMDAIRPLLKENRVVLDMRVDDQDQTHRLLKNGEVVGCVSTEKNPMQGCRVDYLGCMNYRLMSSPEFAAKWFPSGVTPEDVLRAPAIIFNRKDELHHKFLQKILRKAPSLLPTFWVPSSEKFVDFIVSGLAYGLLPDEQSAPSVSNGRMVDLVPDSHVPVKLYWHCWNLKSRLLEDLTQNLVQSAKVLLDK
jgi:LysR family transcriptional regulator (chromosome initiation inhibitor)